jgi:hypothetical protein
MRQDFSINYNASSHHFYQDTYIQMPRPNPGMANFYFIKSKD